MRKWPHVHNQGSVYGVSRNKLLVQANITGMKSIGLVSRSCGPNSASLLQQAASFPPFDTTLY